MATGVETLDQSIGRTNAWLTDIDAGFGTSDRSLAYRMLRAWLHGLRDRLSGDVAAHLAAELPDLLRGAFDGWTPSQVPQKYDRHAYETRFACEAQIREAEVAKAAGIVTVVARRRMSAGVLTEAFGLLPADLREMLEHATAEPAGTRVSVPGPATGTGH